MSVFAWIRDIFGIRRDREETKKLKLEIEKLKAEKSNIKKPELDDIIRYDKKTRKIIYNAKNEDTGRKEVRKYKSSSHRNLFILMLLAAIIVALSMVMSAFVFKFPWW